MTKHKNHRLGVDFPNKCHNDIKHISAAAKKSGIASHSFPKVAVKAMRIGLASIMAMNAEELKEVMK
tara:strand:- start:31082 stop:31282 length:201 start_codon:yes stop_codon:yes gene_type:complete